MVMWFSALLIGGSSYFLLLALRPASNRSLLTRLSNQGASNQQLKRHFSDSSLHRLKLWLRQRFVSKRKLQLVDLELPELIDLLWVGICSGSSLYSALSQVQPRMNGVLAENLDRLLQALDMGATVESELADLAERLPSRQLQEFCHRLIWSIERGTPLVSVLAEQGVAARNEVRGQLTKRAGRNETRMLVPLVFLILPVTVLFATYPSLQLLNLSYL